MGKEEERGKRRKREKKSEKREKGVYKLYFEVQDQASSICKNPWISVLKKAVTKELFSKKKYGNQEYIGMNSENSETQRKVQRNHMERWEIYGRSE